MGQHQTIYDPEQVGAAKATRRDRIEIVRPPAQAEVEVRSLTDYDTLLGIDPSRVGWRDGDRWAAKPAPDHSAELAFLTRAVKSKTLRESIDRLRTRSSRILIARGVPHCLRQREVAARESHGVKAPSVPADSPPARAWRSFDFDHARGLRCHLIAPPAPWTLSPPKTTWCSSAQPAPHNPLLAMGSPSAPAKPATGSSSPLPENGSTGSPRVPRRPAPRRTDPARPLPALRRRLYSLRTGVATRSSDWCLAARNGPRFEVLFLGDAIVTHP
jgi:hypothetical protein